MPSNGTAPAAIALLAVPVAILALVLGFLLLLGSPAEAACGTGNGAGLTIDPSSVPNTEISGYKGEQLVNAAAVMAAGESLSLSVRDQTIGVMTAMGESSLMVLDYGDGVGPDSRGLFQQRANGAWGSYNDRMDPFISSTNYFKAMTKVTDRDSLQPTIVAHRTQHNSDPFYYAPFWEPAVAVIEGLAGVDTGLSGDAGAQVCSTTATTPGQVSTTGWATPAAGPITSQYGMRTNPVSGIYKLHSGTDLGGGGCDGPIWAAQSGTVITTGLDSQGNGTIVLDHGDGIETAYLHMYPSGILVREGAIVTAGEQIARVGNSGNSRGCHLHFVVRLNGSPTDPVPFMSDAGAPLG